MSSLYGLLGESLKHSISPTIHALVFRELKMEGEYHLFEVQEEELQNTVVSLKEQRARGVNVTIPYKIAVMKYLDEISIEAKNISAVNTLCFHGDKIIGYNTDYYGFGSMLEKNEIEVRNKKIVVLGSGGAAKSVLQYLLDKGSSEIIVVSRDKEKTKEIYNKKEFQFLSYEELQSLKEKDIIINTTPCGMFPKVEISPVVEKVVTRFPVAVDLIYNPEETLFLKYAKQGKSKAVNGLYMLVGQAIKAQELWNTIKISEEIVDKIYNKIRQG